MSFITLRIKRNSFGEKLYQDVELGGIAEDVGTLGRKEIKEKAIVFLSRADASGVFVEYEVSNSLSEKKQINLQSTLGD